MALRDGCKRHARRYGSNQSVRRDEAIINAYEMRTGLSRTILAHMIADETYMNARKCIELGFADEMLVDEKRSATEDDPFVFSARSVTNSRYDRMRRIPHNSTTDSAILAESLE